MHHTRAPDEGADCSPLACRLTTPGVAEHEQCLSRPYMPLGMRAFEHAVMSWPLGRMCASLKTFSCATVSAVTVLLPACVTAYINLLVPAGTT